MTEKIGHFTPPDRGEIANRLWWLDNADEEGFDTEQMAIASHFYTQVMRDIYLRKADQILALFDKDD